MNKHPVTFRGISAYDVLKNYKNGKYDNATFPGKIQIVKHEKYITKANDVYVKFHEISHHSHKSITCLGYMSSDSKYVYRENLYGVDHEKSLNCMYCLKPSKRVIGIPVALKFVDSNKVFYCIDVFCGLRCALAELKLRIPQSPTFYEPCISLIYNLYTEMTGKDYRELKPSMNKYLLQIFNGPYTYEEFHSYESYSTTFNHIRLLPAFLYLEKS